MTARAILPRFGVLAALVFIVIAVLVAGLAGIGGLGLWIYKSLPAGEPVKQLPDGTNGPAERGLRELRTGDILTIGGTDFVCEGAIGYEEMGHRWVCGLIVDTAASHWVLAGLERSSEPTVYLLDVEPSLRLNSYPSETLRLGTGEAFVLEKRGNATCKLAGDVRFLARAPNQMKGSVEYCRWWLYRAQAVLGATSQHAASPPPAPQILLVEQWGSDYRVLRGGTLALRDIAMMPGS